MTAAIPSMWRKFWKSGDRNVVSTAIQSNLNWGQTIATADLPPELAQAVATVVGHSRLWRREKAAVAAELIAHFHDGLDAGCAPADLLQSFGDAKMAGQLISRAKKRGRSLGWQLWHIGWISALAFLLVYVAIGVWMSAGQPTVKVDYLASVNQTALSVPENERAWPIYREAFREIGTTFTKVRGPNLNVPQYDSKPGDEHWTEVSKALTDHARAIAKLREAASRPKLGFVAATSKADFSQKDRELFGFNLTNEEIEAAKHENWRDRFLMSTLMLHLPFLQSSARLLAYDADQAIAAGDGQTVFDDAFAILAISRHCQETPFLISAMLASGIQNKAHAIVHNVLSEKPDLWTDAQLRGMAHQIAASRINWRRGFDGERSIFYDCMQRLYTDNGDGDGRLALQVTKDKNLFQLLDDVGGNSEAAIFGKPGVATLSMPLVNLLVASRSAMSEVYDKYTNKALAMLDKPYWEWSRKLPLDDEIALLAQDPIARFRYLFVVLLTPSYEGALNRIVANDGNRDGALIGLALELYHRENGKWPKSLAVLSPRWLPAIPADPITGQPLRYKVVKDRPIVYSVGIDGDDDGGRWVNNANGDTFADLGAPNHFDGVGESVRFEKRDGDWVLWSSLERPNATENSSELKGNSK
jgi:hypothetical protein